MFWFIAPFLYCIIVAKLTSVFIVQDFEIDVESKEYLALHPVAASKKQPSLVDEHFELVSEDEDSSDASALSESSDDEADNETKQRKKARVPR